MKNNFWIYVAQSIKTPSGKVSITRISSYFILATILIGTLLIFGIDLANAILCYHKGTTYTIPTEHLWAFGMILGHHLALLGINKSAETKEAVTGINMGLPQPNFNGLTASAKVEISTDTPKKDEKGAAGVSGTPKGSTTDSTTDSDEGKTFEDPEL